MTNNFLKDPNLQDYYYHPPMIFQDNKNSIEAPMHKGIHFPLQPFITPQNFPNSSSILNLKKEMSFQTYSFRSPNHHHHLHMKFINMHPNNLVDFAPCFAF